MELNDLYIECNRRLQALNAHGENTETYGRILAPKIIRSFPTEICCCWIIYAKREKLAEGNVTRLMKFLAEEVECSVEEQKIRAESPIKLSESFVMVPSMFGWILSESRTHTTITDNTSVQQVSVQISTDCLNDQVRCLWELDSIGIQDIKKEE
ncbi:integrase catalytic domain-containing protein [Nephila pilipes]|uniref:Integrase catalytic domain-containing protein n=1 Tax=Nephila pilipes TaxID=299642 RepID=A0A8X6PNT8_NEPPI|nr:integrase catalytic domain-containing protein [Nephila pilipes]